MNVTGPRSGPGPREALTAIGAEIIDAVDAGMVTTEEGRMLPVLGADLLEGGRRTRGALQKEEWHSRAVAERRERYRDPTNLLAAMNLTVLPLHLAGTVLKL